MDIIVHTLGYADNLGLVDKDSESRAGFISKRATRIAEGSRKYTDMFVSLLKTNILHVCKQEKVTKTLKKSRKQWSTKNSFVTTWGVDMYIPYSTLSKSSASTRANTVTRTLLKWKTS